MKAKKLVTNAVIAAIYAACSILLAPISYGVMQFRISEALTLLPFLKKDTVWGLTVGCFLANLLSPLGANPLDIVFGTLATFIAAVLTSKCRLAPAAVVPPVAVNGVVIGAVLAYTLAPDTFWASFSAFAVQIAVEELVVCALLGLPLLYMLKKLGVMEK